PNNFLDFPLLLTLLLRHLLPGPLSLFPKSAYSLVRLLLCSWSSVDAGPGRRRGGRILVLLPLAALRCHYSIPLTHAALSNDRHGGLAGSRHGRAPPGISNFRY